MSKCHLCPQHCNKQTAAFDQCAIRIRTNYETFCNQYLRLFCQKHEFDYSEAKDSWVAEDIGGVACVGDFCFNMATIRTDIDRDAPESSLMRWYEYNLETGYLDLPGCNFDSWLRGCPRVSEEEFARFRVLRENKERAEQILIESISKYKETFQIID